MTVTQETQLKFNRFLCLPVLLGRECGLQVRDNVTYAQTTGPISRLSPNFSALVLKTLANQTERELKRGCLCETQNRVKPNMAPRKVPLNKSDKGTAKFFLLVSPGKVEQAKFIKGDDNLKTFVDVLQKSDVQMKFPPQSQTHVVRRAVVRCGTTSPAPCTVELVPSAEVRSLE